MVTTRSSTSSVPRDDNRIIIVVTGANSGFGLGICQQLLSNLSLPPGTPIPASRPQPTALPPGQGGLLTDYKPSENIPSDPPTLTLILACRSDKNAQQAREILLKEHEEVLRKRQEAGMEVRRGWREGLRIQGEIVDFDTVEGPCGIISFCERLKDKYPHITSLFLNAGMASYKGNDYLRFIWQIFTQGLIRPITYGTFSSEHAGIMSADGRRGKVWGVNVLAPYILAKELAPLLKLSPASLPLSPRIIYTSSGTAEFVELKENPLDDYQLITYGEDWSSSVYRASKYCGDLVMLQLDLLFDKEAQTGERGIRVFIGDPGCVLTNIAISTFGSIGWIITFLQFCQSLTFWFARLLGSKHHPIYAMQGALPMIYAALISDRFVQPASKVPAQKFAIHARRFEDALVDYGEVDRWEESLDIGEGMVRACEAIRVMARRKEGLE